MIQIDDAGSGSFIGGTCIGIYRPETNEYYFDIIPVELYNKENFKHKLYLDKVVDIVSYALDIFKVPSHEVIEVCRGYMFDKLKPWLDSRSYSWYCTQITGHVQQVVEKNFELYTERLGLPRQYIKYTRYPFHFHKVLRWVFADYDNRILNCKVGWKCWQKVENTQIDCYEEITDLSHLYCLKCGKHIRKGSKIKVLRFFSNREQFVYLHPYC